MRAILRNAVLSHCDMFFTCFPTIFTRIPLVMLLIISFIDIFNQPSTPYSIVAHEGQIY